MTEINCTTHHFACDCREAMFKELDKAQQEWYQFNDKLGHLTGDNWDKCANEMDKRGFLMLNLRKQLFGEEKEKL